MFTNFKSRFTLAWLDAAITRALHTFFQTALGYLAVGTVLTDVNWIELIEISGTAALISLIKSFATNLPEVETRIEVDQIDIQEIDNIDHEDDE